MESVETVRDVEAVVHGQGSVVDGGWGEGEVDPGELLMMRDLRGGCLSSLYTPLDTANIGAVQVDRE